MSNIFYEGQKVGCLMYGEGVICEIGQRLKVDFGEWKTTYLMTGAFEVGCRPTLYPIEQYRAIIANLPAPQPAGRIRSDHRSAGGRQEMNWYVGQQVYCLRYGEGVIIDTQFTDSYPIKAGFNNYNYHYTADGKLYIGDKTPMLYPAKPEIIVPKWQPKPGEWCWFWDDNFTNGNQPVLSKFKGIQDGLFQGEFYKWQHCAPFTGELPEHLKKVQP